MFTVAVYLILYLIIQFVKSNKGKVEGKKI